MTFPLLLGAAVILACLLAHRLSHRFGIPTLLLFILLGMMFGSDGLLKIPFDDYSFAEAICSAALILIMFYGGFGTSWKEARPVARPALLLASAGVVLTSLLTGLFCHLVLGFSMLEGMLVGAVLGSTDAASVFSILRSKRLGLRLGTASLLEVESGSNDPFAYMLTVLLLSALQTGSLSLWQAGLLIGRQLVLGACFGLAIGWLTPRLLRRFSFGASGLDAVCVFALAVLSYALPALLGGNGYLSAYLAGLLIGNQPIPNKRSLVSFFDGLTGLMQMLIFFLLGLLSFPSRIPAVLPTALAVALFLTVIARPAAVAMLLTPLRHPFRQQLLISWSGLRGAASIVFAIMVTVSGAQLQNDLFHIVFTVVLLSISIQGTLLPHAAHLLGMVDDAENVMRTFTDYADETAVQFVQLRISPGHIWEGLALRDLGLPPDLLIASVQRGQETLLPQGSTVLQAGDVAVLAAQGFDGAQAIGLYELTIDRRRGWNGLSVRELPLTPDELIVMIRRGTEIVIPNGQTVLALGDVLVINRRQGTCPVPDPLVHS